MLPPHKRPQRSPLLFSPSESPRLRRSSDSFSPKAQSKSGFGFGSGAPRSLGGRSARRLSREWGRGCGVIQGPSYLAGTGFRGFLLPPGPRVRGWGFTVTPMPGVEQTRSAKVHPKRTRHQGIG